MAAVQPGALAAGPNVTNKQTNRHQADLSLHGHDIFSVTVFQSA
jgi:hypothetical protein